MKKKEAFLCRKLSYNVIWMQYWINMKYQSYDILLISVILTNIKQFFFIFLSA